MIELSYNMFFKSTYSASVDSKTIVKYGCLVSYMKLFMKWFFATLLHPFITLCKNVIGDHYCMQQQRKWALPFVKNFHFLTDPWQKSERARGNWTMNRFARSLLLYHNGLFHLQSKIFFPFPFCLLHICLFFFFWGLPSFQLVQKRQFSTSWEDKTCPRNFLEGGMNSEFVKKNFLCLLFFSGDFHLLS